jgi:hypothetical protein
VHSVPQTDITEVRILGENETRARKGEWLVALAQSYDASARPIYGVEYDSPEHLITRFDIRACSMAIDPNTNMLYVVRGSIEDTTRKQLVFNPVPRGVSVRRFTKYIQKGFTPDKHQNVFFVELLRSDIYSQELELMTKDY